MEIQQAVLGGGGGVCGRKRQALPCSWG